MNYGLYSAFLGMRARQHTLDTIANNIANASTSGFKADRLFHHSVEAAEQAALQSKNTPGQPVSQANAQPDATPPNNARNASAGSASASSVTATAAANPASAIERAFGVVSGGVTDYSTGSFQETGRPLDVSLSGEGFLVVQTSRGERYTRAGSLTIDASGQLVTQRGELVVGDGGPITVRNGAVVIGEDGGVSAGGQNSGRLKVVRFTDVRAALTKEGDSLFTLTGREKPQRANGTRVVQGVLEMSNVNVVSEMALMMENSREFDSLQRSVALMMNDLGRKVAGEIGRI